MYIYMCIHCHLCVYIYMPRHTYVLVCERECVCVTDLSIESRVSLRVQVPKDG